MSDKKLRVPTPLQFTPSCFRCGAQGVAEHKPTCPNFTPPSAGKAIDEMMADLAASEKCPYKTTKLMVAHNREACETLYNAGYRKGELK
jgi:hypothetical protein